MDNNISTVVMPLSTRTINTMFVLGSPPKEPATIEVKVSTEMREKLNDDMYAHHTVVLCECEQTGLKIALTVETQIFATGKQEEIFKIVKSEIQPTTFKYAEKVIDRLAAIHGVALHIPISNPNENE